MKRTRPHDKSLSREAEKLVRLAQDLAASGSRVEDEFWERSLRTMIEKLLAAGNDDALFAALDHAFNLDRMAYDELADAVEARSESPADNALLFAVPVLAWSRFAVPAGSLKDEVVLNLRVQLSVHVFAAGVELSLADCLLSPDQLPRGFSETRKLAVQLLRALDKAQTLSMSSTQLPPTAPFLSDARYLVGLARAHPGQPLFHWQEQEVSRESVLKTWQTQGGEAMRPALPACALQLLLPNAYFAAAREADRQLRAFSLGAAVDFLAANFSVAPAQLRVVIAPYGDRELEEYRVSFGLMAKTGLVHGIVWPLLDTEDVEGIPDDIARQLQALGVKDITVLEGHLPLEYCEDCGAPLFPTPSGDSVHTEEAEESGQAPQHLH
ncbi:MAG TPA: DUF2863 family protein [Thiobacillaceae bacterium]|nr:DUF2863 family protein [Thiobacillaceae bacterium]